MNKDKVINDLLSRIATLEWEIERLKEQLNDEIDEELKQSEIMVKKQEEIERLNNIIKRLENEINGAYSDLSNNLNANYMHEAFKKDLLEILGDKENER